MPVKMGDKIRLQHILDAIKEIEIYVEKADYNLFISNSMMRFACIKQLEIIGEAANLISEETKSAQSDVKWRQIIGMRNLFVHEYFGIDPHIVWQIIQTDLPEFKIHIVQMVKNL